MRPGQNKRMRGRSNNNNSNRKGPNPLTRSYESNGPDVKIRGTAHHIGEKYLQLARDAQSSGDPVMAESYLQHAEHYFRLIAAAQQQLQQAQYGYQRTPADQVEADEDGDEDFVSLPDRFASPSERSVQPQPQAPQPYPDRQPYSDRQPPQSYEPRQDRSQGQERYEGQPRHSYQDRQPQDRQPQPSQERQYQDRQQQERQPFESRERTYDNRRDRPPYGDRNGAPDRGGAERGPDGPPKEGAHRNGQDRQPREYDNRNFRNRNRDYRDNPPRESRQPAVDETPNGLPAFITGATRLQPEGESQPNVPEAELPLGEATEEAGYHLRPRRRRRPKSEFGGETEGRTETPAPDPVGD